MEMIELQDVLHKIGIHGPMIHNMSEMVAVAMLAESRWTEAEFDKKYYENRGRVFPPPPQANADLSDEQTCEITAVLMSLKMSKGEMVIFIQHVRTILAFIALKSKKPVVH